MNQNSNMTIKIPFAESFDCNKMKVLVKGDDKQTFNDRFREWLNAYTKPAREKIWMDIESYK